MESSRWGSLSSCVQQQLWSQRQPEIREDDDCSSLGGNVDLVDNLFNSGHDIHGHKSSNLASDFGSANGIIQELAPAIDSIIVGSNLNLFQRQEAMRLAKSGAGSGTTWGKALTGGELCSPLINRLYSNTPLSSLMPGVDKLQVPTTGMQVDTLGVSADSLESLDCLLSASNSNTDTSVEDDGISMLFSECKSIWNFNSSGAISSGESENNGKASKPEENVSKSCTNPSDTRPSSSKRAKEREEVKTSVNYRHFDIFQSDSSTTEGGFKLISENPSKLKKPRLEKQQKTSNINFQQPYSSISSSIDEPDTEAIAQVKEMIYRAAVLRPVSLDLDVVEKPKRKNVKISSDPQTVAARQRRERISERIRILQRLVPGGNKMDTASMLDEAANYLKFLRSQIKALEAVGHNKFDSMYTTTNLPYPSFPFNNQNFPMQPFFPFSKP